MKQETENSSKIRTPIRHPSSDSNRKSEWPLKWLYSIITGATPFSILFMIVITVLAGVLPNDVCQAVSNSPLVRVGTELEFPPYAFTDSSGELTGFSIDLIKAISDTMGFSIKISTGSWDDVWNDLAAGWLDVLPIVAKSPERQLRVDFSLPHTETFDAFFVRQGDLPIKTIADAQGKEIVVMRSDAAHHELLDRNFQKNLILVDTIPDGLRLISSGKHSALLCSKLIGTLLIKYLGLSGLTTGPPIPDYKRVFSFAVKKGDIELLEKLNQGLLIIKTNGVYGQIYDKWFMGDDPWLKMKKYFLPAIITVITIALIAGIWLLTLQRLVHKRNKELAMRMTAEEELRESERKYRSIFENAVEGFFQSTPEGRFITVNPAFAKMTGYTSAEELVFSITDIAKQFYVNPEDRNRLKQLLNEAGFVEHFVFEARCKDSSHIWGSYNIHAIYDHNGKIIRYEGSMTDITEQKQAETERSQLVTAIEQTAELIAITALNGTIQYTNPAFENITGYSRQEAVGNNPRLLKSGLHDPSVYQKLWDTILSGNRWTGQFINKRKDGAIYTSECSISPVKDSKGNLLNFIWIAKDITNELELEKRILQSQKMESIGALAGGIAHDLNNILFPISGLSELLLDDMPAGSPEHKSIEQIHRSANRGSEMIKQILSFSRQSNPQKLPIRIQPILQEVLQLVRASIPMNININNDIKADCGMVLADPTQVHQIVMNLITNAYHAVEGSAGTIKLELTEVDFQKDDLHDIMTKSGKYACISVGDNGTGIDLSLIDKIFEPYFTTKKQGKGTGLGLSVVHGIVKDHGGDIRVISDVGKGTVFHVYLPLLEDAKDSKPVDINSTHPTGNESILVIDDEAPIATMMRMMLEKMGYQVTIRTNSRDALDTFRTNPNNFDLVITDRGMPNMTGEQLVHEFLSIRPGIPIIFCSGFYEDSNEKTVRNMGVKGLLQKPVSISDLAGMARKVLDEAAGAKLQ
jgi:PAS domain S-box-containing protein